MARGRGGARVRGRGGGGGFGGGWVVAHGEYGSAGGTRRETRANAGSSCVLWSFLVSLLVVRGAGEEGRKEDEM
jgi:hypothetical protein